MIGRLLARLRHPTKREDAVETEGVITALHRDFTVFINHRPIYGMLEYRYRDRSGAWRTRRIERLNVELAQPAGWDVGASIRVRYRASDPGQSVIAA